MVLFLLALLSVVFSLAALFYLPAPYVWVLLAWGGFFLYASIYNSTYASTNASTYASGSSKKGTARVLSFNMALILVLLACVEAYLWAFPGPESMKRDKGYSPGSYIYHDDGLGHAPKKDKSTSFSRYYGDEFLYDVVYTIGPDGLRVPPPPPHGSPTHEGGCVLFFGGSMTYGEGVNDNETVPYLVGEKSGYRVYNFGFHGYGPHQMLASFDKGLVERVVECEPGHAVYQAIIGHVARSAGITTWDEYGPEYVLADDGAVTYRGNFNNKAISFAIHGLQRSFIYRRYSHHSLLNRYEGVGRAETELFLAIVGAARTRFLERYPGGKFHVLFWEKPIWQRDAEWRHRTSRAVLKGFEKMGMDVHIMSDILGDYESNPRPFHIKFPYEMHPSVYANGLIAEYVVENLLGE